ncbi:hypothetical protein L7F22_020875 [Adiantum nelumboides]|nr:hypothetical protein [Adiantum nelumboides]
MHQRPVYVLWRAWTHCPTLSKEEKDKGSWYNNLKIFGKLGHPTLIEAGRLDKDQVKEGLFLPADPTSRFMLPVKIQMWDMQMDCEALLDSSATACFMNKDFARKQGIPLVEKSSPISIEVTDGRFLASGDVWYETHPLEVTIKNHVSRIAFNIIQCLGNPNVIGLPWLELHNPSIDWISQSIEARQAQKKERSIQILYTLDLSSSLTQQKRIQPF